MVPNDHEPRQVSVGHDGFPKGFRWPRMISGSTQCSRTCTNRKPRAATGRHSSVLLKFLMVADRKFPTVTKRTGTIPDGHEQFTVPPHVGQIIGSQLTI